MPELPEVETTRRGIAPALTGSRLDGALVRNPALRWPVPEELSATIRGQRVIAVERRAKYLLLRMERGTLILHLGMSGRLRVVAADTPAAKHDHVDIQFAGDRCLRLNDPRRFGAVLWHSGPDQDHMLLRRLGPEPLSDEFSADYMYRKAQGRRGAIKNFLMDGHIVVGIGNIYASEALYRAGIHPRRPAGRVSLARLQRLEGACKEVLLDALAHGGTTLRDYVSPDGAPGYFSVALNVYDKAGQACPGCGGLIRREVIGQRSTFFCPKCQR